MKNEKQRIKNILKKRISRFLVKRPDWKINPNKFNVPTLCGLVVKETCVLGVVVFKTNERFISCYDPEIRLVAAKELSLAYSQVRQLENGFMQWEMHIAEPETEFTQLGLELRSWVKEKFPEQVNNI